MILGIWNRNCVDCFGFYYIVAVKQRNKHFTAGLADTEYRLCSDYANIKAGNAQQRNGIKQESRAAQSRVISS